MRDFATMYGRKAAAPPEATKIARPMGDAPLPWEEDYLFQANVAVADFGECLAQVLTGEGGLDAQILIATSGALIGIAANHAAFNVALGEGGLQTMGGGFVVGPRINQYLIRENDEILPAFGLIAGGARKAGASLEDIAGIDLRAMALKAGGPRQPMVEIGVGHAQAFWPFARTFLSRTDHPLFRGEALPERYWPGVLALLAQRHIVRVRDRLDPATAASLAIEAAFAASAIDRREQKQVAPRRLHA